MLTVSPGTRTSRGAGRPGRGGRGQEKGWVTTRAGAGYSRLSRSRPGGPRGAARAVGHQAAGQRGQRCQAADRHQDGQGVGLGLRAGLARRADAGGAAGGAGAGDERRRRRFEDLAVALVELGGQPDAGGVVVAEEHGGASGEGILHLGNGDQVAGVAHQEQGGHVLQEVGQPQEPALEAVRGRGGRPGPDARPASRRWSASPAAGRSMVPQPTFSAVPKRIFL